MNKQNSLNDEKQRFEQRRNRFIPQPIPPSPSVTTDTLIGTCDKLEKDYLRLTSAPHPSTVRPLKILEQAFRFVLENYHTNPNWSYISNQLKSIRQDLVIQGIRNDFTVVVYEENARLALEMGDRDQFIQCQSQLEMLYDSGCNQAHLMEFLTYRLLYSLLLNDNKKVNRILFDMNQFKHSTTDLDYTLQFCSCLRRKDYFQLFHIYKLLPKLACCLAEFFLQIYRREFVRILISGFSPTLPIDFLADILAYQSTDLCLEHLHSLGIQIDDESQMIDCKQSRISWKDA